MIKFVIVILMFTLISCANKNNLSNLSNTSNDIDEYNSLINESLNSKRNNINHASVSQNDALKMFSYKKAKAEKNHSKDNEEPHFQKVNTKKKEKDNTLISYNQNENSDTLQTEHFTMPSDEFEKIFNSLPEQVRKNISSKYDFLEDIYVLSKLDKRLLILIDKTHSKIDYSPKNLIKLIDYKNQLFLNKETLSFEDIGVKPLIEMTKDARKDGIKLDITSTYRDIKYQEMLFNRYVKELGEKEAQRQSAKPGTSQHQLGLALDFGKVDVSYENTDAFKWLMQNAYKYGFSLSFPNGYEKQTGYMYEPWHFRYIGVEACLLQKKYFVIQQYLLEFWDSNKESITKYINQN